MPNSIKCLFNVKKHSCAYELFFKGKGDLIYNTVDLMYCGMIMPKFELSIGKVFFYDWWEAFKNQFFKKILEVK